MTQELVLGFDFEDITEVELVCKNSKCGGRLSVPPNTWSELPDKCPYCGTFWYKWGIHFIQVTPRSCGRLHGVSAS